MAWSLKRIPTEGLVACSEGERDQTKSHGGSERTRTAILTCKHVCVHHLEAIGNSPLQVIVRHVHQLRRRQPEVGNGATEPVVVQPQLEKLGQRGDGRRDRAREPVVGEMELLEPAHAGEGVVRDLTGELVRRQVYRPQALYLPDLRHRPLQVVPQEAKGAKPRQALEEAELGQ